MKIKLISSGSDSFSRDTWDEGTEVFGNEAFDLGPAAADVNDVRVFVEGLVGAHNTTTWQWLEGNDCTLELVTGSDLTGRLELDIPLTDNVGGYADMASTELSFAVAFSLNNIKSLAP